MTTQPPLDQPYFGRHGEILSPNTLHLTILMAFLMSIDCRGGA